MRRFFIDKNSIDNRRVIIAGQEAHHIRDVIRLKIGDRFIGFDGTGNSYTLRLLRSSDIIEAEIEKISSKRPDAPRILLACAVPKLKKIEYIIEKATELGVSDILPMITDRTSVRFDKKAMLNKNIRWKKIALEASKQCGRDILPKVHSVLNFKEAIKLIERLRYKNKIIPCLSEGSRYLKEIINGRIDDIAILIGPEGDFADREVDYARERGFKPVSLGELVLKVDTACIFTISVVRGIMNR